MRGLMWVGVVAAVVAVGAPMRPAQAYWRGGGYGWGGFAAGAAIGATVGVLAARPYYYGSPYAYAPPYPYYPAPVYAAPAPYPYPAPGYVYAPPPYAQGAVPVPPAYANAQPPASGPVRGCGVGMFFNTLTGNCDRR